MCKGINMKDADQKKRGYTSENINYRGYRSEKAWIQIGERTSLLWVRVRERVGRDKTLGTDQGPGTD